MKRIIFTFWLLAVMALSATATADRLTTTIPKAITSAEEAVERAIAFTAFDSLITTPFEVNACIAESITVEINSKYLVTDDKRKHELWHIFFEGIDLNSEIAKSRGYDILGTKSFEILLDRNTGQLVCAFSPPQDLIQSPIEEKISWVELVLSKVKDKYDTFAKEDPAYSLSYSLKGASGCGSISAQATIARYVNYSCWRIVDQPGWSIICIPTPEQHKSPNESFIPYRHCVVDAKTGEWRFLQSNFEEL